METYDKLREKYNRILKFRKSESLSFNCDEWHSKYELNNRSAEHYIKKQLRDTFVNKDTGDEIRVTRRGAEKVTRHDAESAIHLKSIAFIPDMLRNSIYITEEPNNKGINGFETFKYYVMGLKMCGEDYTVKVVVGVKGKLFYYDHALTKIEKTNLLNDIDEIKRPFDTKETNLFSDVKDKRLLSILQI